MDLHAVPETGDREIIYPKHTIMRFADETVDGNLATPEYRDLTRAAELRRMAIVDIDWLLEQ